MKISLKKIIGLSVSLICLGFATYLLLQSKQVEQKNVHALRIAIFEPATHPAIDEIAQAFIDEMKKSYVNYSFTRYNANGNKILLYSQAQEIVQQQYDLVFTIGLGCSVTMKEVACKQQSSMPIIFCAVDDYIKFGLQGGNVTAVIDHTNYAEQLNLTLQLKPSIKNILLIYDVSQGSGLEKDTDEIRSILKEKNIHLQTVEINSLNEIQQKVTAFMDTADLVMILKDNTIVSGIDILIKLCQKFQVPLLASDLNSGVKGAVLAYGIYESDCGVQAAEQAQLILEQEFKPDEIALAVVESMVMKVNREQAAKQGLALDFENISIPNIELN